MRPCVATVHKFDTLESTIGEAARWYSSTCPCFCRSCLSNHRQETNQLFVHSLSCSSGMSYLQENSARSDYHRNGDARCPLSSQFVRAWLKWLIKEFRTYSSSPSIHRTKFSSACCLFWRATCDYDIFLLTVIWAVYGLEKPNSAATIAERKRETFQYYLRRITVLLNSVDLFVVQDLYRGTIGIVCEYYRTKL